MSPELVSNTALVVIFAIATVYPINMGALAFVAAFLVGTLAVGLDTEEILGSDEVTVPRMAGVRGPRVAVIKFRV